MKFTIRTKLLIGFTLLLVLSSFVQAITFSITRKYIASQIADLQTVQAKKGESEIQNFFNPLVLQSAGIAALYNKQDKNIASVAHYIITNNASIKKIVILSPFGKEQVLFDGSGEIPQNALGYESSSDAFRVALAGKQAVSNVYFRDKASEPYVDMFFPNFGAKREVATVIKLQVSLVKLRQTLSAVKIGENGYLYVVNQEGRLVLHTSDAYMLEQPDLTSRKLIDNGHYTNEKQVSVISKAVKTAPYDWVVVFEQPVSEAFGFLIFIRNLFLATFLGSSAVLLLIALLLSQNLTSSVRKLQKSAKLIEQGQLTTNILINSGDEIESLSYSFASMVNQLLQRESLLRNEKLETEVLLQALTDGVVALDQDNNIIVFNKAAERMTGLQAQAVLGDHIDLCLHLYEYQELIAFSSYSQQSETTVKKLKEKGLAVTSGNGERTILSITVVPIVFGEREGGYIMTFHDITKEQELEEMKLDFVSIAAHELRTPLTAIRGYASLLEMQSANTIDPTGREIIKRLVISSENLGNLIENLLSVSRIERSMFSVDARPVDLSTTIKNVVDSVRQQATTKQQKITLLIPDELPIVMADVFRIGQVALNLVANAINYTDEGGSITVRAEKKGNTVEFSVTDTGRGIPQDALSKLFTKFFRVSGALKQGSKGTGLGLYISRSIIEMHKGKIWVESQLGKGSTFAFSLVLARPEDITAYQKTKIDLTAKNGQAMIVEKTNKT